MMIFSSLNALPTTILNWKAFFFFIGSVATSSAYIICPKYPNEEVAKSYTFLANKVCPLKVSKLVRINASHDHDMSALQLVGGGEREEEKN